MITRTPGPVSVLPALAVGAALLFGPMGCSTTAANVTEVETEPFGTKVLVGDPDLYEQMHVIVDEVLTRRRTEAGFLEAQATLVNDSAGTIRFEYSFEWYDRQGFKIKDAKQHWTPAQIYGRRELPIQGVAPHPDATSFKISVRRPQEIK